MKFYVLKFKNIQILLLEWLKASEVPFNFLEKICTECYTQQEHFKIYGSFEFQDTVKCLKNIP